MEHKIQEIRNSVSYQYDVHYNRDNVYSLVLLKKVELMEHIIPTVENGKYSIFPNYYFLHQP